MSGIVLVLPPERPKSKAFAVPVLAPFLKAHGIPVEVVDLHSKDEIYLVEAAVRRINADMVGVSISSTPSLAAGRFVLKHCQVHLPDTFLVAGGIQARLYPKSLTDIADIVVVGEGEETLLELMRSSKMNRFSVPGIAFEKDGIIHTTKPRSLIRNLDETATPDWTLLRLEWYPYVASTLPKAASLLTSRGCPYNCIFCSNWKLGQRKLRYLSVDRVLQDVHQVTQDLHTQNIFFHDDFFTANRERTLQLCRGLREMNVHWTCQTRADHLDKELLVEMKHAGCHTVAIGAEVGYEEGLRKLRKLLSLDDIRKGVKLIKETCIKCHVGFMIGLPWESPKEILKTIHFAIELDPDAYGFAIATPYHGTDLYTLVRKMGISVEEDAARFKTDVQTFIPPLLKGYRLEEVQCFATDCLQICSSSTSVVEYPNFMVKFFFALKRSLLKQYLKRCLNNWYLPRRYWYMHFERFLKNLFHFLKNYIG